MADEKIIQNLRRIEGQVKGIQRMVGQVVLLDGLTQLEAFVNTAGYHVDAALGLKIRRRLIGSVIREFGHWGHWPLRHLWKESGQGGRIEQFYSGVPVCLRPPSV